MLFYILALALLPSTQACLSSGACGGCSPPPAVSCTPSSCQPGYSCGSYGCARNRARSSLTRKINGIFLESSPSPPTRTAESRNVFGLLRKSPQSAEEHENTRPSNNSEDVIPTNPNSIFRACCEERRLPDSCLSKCNFNKLTRDALQSMYLRVDECPLAAAAEMQFCAAQGRDHRPCCVRNQVGTTLAGAKCLTFCDQTPDRITQLDYSYIPCYDRFENMKRCFFDDLRSNSERPTLPRPSEYPESSDLP